MSCEYCNNLKEGTIYRVEGDGFCVGCRNKIYSDGVNVIYTGLLRGFHRFKTEGMSICGNCGLDLSEMTLLCFEKGLCWSEAIKLIEVQGE
jgi:hypothetical protein